MKLRFTLFFAFLLATVAFAQDGAEATADAPPTEGFEHTKGEDVLINLQGENEEMWIISFFQPGDNYVEVRDLIKNAMTDKLPDEEYNYGEVSLTSGYDYQNLFETLDLVGEPKRGHTTPQVLFMKKGKGYIVYGPSTQDAIVKRFAEISPKNTTVAA